MVVTAQYFVPHAMTPPATTRVVVMERRCALLDGLIPTVCLVLLTIMAVTAQYFVPHVMTPLAIILAVQMGGKYALSVGLEGIA